jgi:hypothetical protein
VKRILVIFLLSSGVFAQAQSSLLAEGDWVKFSVTERGIYRLRGVDLQAAGISLAGVNPSEIRVGTMPGGPLPQILEEGTPPGLREIPVAVTGVEDGTFDPQDQILFYLEGPDRVRSTDEGPDFEYNPYSQKNYVFVGINAGAGTRISTPPLVNSPGTVYNTFTDLRFYKFPMNNLLESGREWYGQRLQSGQAAAIDFTFPQLINGSNVRITSAVMAQSFSPATFTVSWDGAVAGEHQIQAVPDFLNPPTGNPFRYSVKGRDDIATFTTTATTGSGVYRLLYSYTGEGSARSVGYLNYVVIEAERALSLQNGNLLFAGKGAGTYRVAFSETLPVVWDVTDLYNPFQVTVRSASGSLEFDQQEGGLRLYTAFTPATVGIPALEGPVDNQNLPEDPAANLLIVTHADFIDAANTLASHRSAYNQYQVRVVTAEEIYNEYSSGRQDVTAIRNYARELSLKGDLRYLLLIGKGTYDYLNILGTNSHFIPTYESRNSLQPLDSYASDDYFGFLETGEGAWEEKSGGNHTLDIGVGRLPVTSASQANAMVEKIMRYDLEPDTRRDWRSRLVFVADDEDFNLHHRQAEELAEFTDTTFKDYRSKKIYLGAYEQETGTGGQSAPGANEEIDRTVQNGSLIINYTGHGGENGWAQEAILTRLMIEQWQNRNKLPLFVTATCEFGRHDNPRQVSGGEMVVTMPQGGAIALLSTGRPVFANSNFEVNKAFYESVFDYENGVKPALGDVFKNTKNASINEAIDINRVGNRNFTLLGDPSQVLAYPQKEIRITSIVSDGAATDTLKAGARVHIEAEVVLENGLRDMNFSGKADLAVLDKPVVKQTLIDPVFTYSSWENFIFKGKSTVTEGAMSFEFVVPAGITQPAGKGRIQLYAYDQGMDAVGGSDSVEMGGISLVPPSDTEGPQFSIHFGDSINTSRTNINDNTLLFVKLTDESGINLSGFSSGNSLRAILDEEVFVLNEYYTAVENSFQTGWVAFPLYDLEKGQHTLTIQAWDVYNNPGETTITFSVADPGTLVLNNVMNYPQPVFDQTTFRFDHNRAGEDLDVVWELIGSHGQLIEKNEFRIEDSPSSVILATWQRGDGTKKLDPGIYFYSIGVRSTLDGAAAKKYQKLILID